MSWQRTLWIVFFAQLISAVGFSVFFPFLPVYVHQLGTRTSLSLDFWSAAVYSGQALTMMVASPFWGAVADRYGHKPMLARATFGGAVILLMMGFVTSAEQLALLRAIQGVITGTIAAANALVAAVAPRERLGYAMGVLQIGLWGGVAAGPFIGGLIADVFGFRTVFVLTATLLLLSGVVVWRGIPHIRPDQARRARKPGGLAGWRTILSAPGVAQVYLLRFMGALPQSMLLPILPLFVLALMPESERVNSFTGLVVGLNSAAATASALYLGRLGDRIGHRSVLIGCTLVAGLLYLPQSMVTDGWQLLALQTLIGLAIGGVIPSISALLARFTPQGTEGAVYGLDNSVSSGSRALAPLIGSGVAAALGLRSVLALTGVVLLLTCAVAVFGLPKPGHDAEPAHDPEAAEAAESVAKSNV